VTFKCSVGQRDIQVQHLPTQVIYWWRHITHHAAVKHVTCCVKNLIPRFSQNLSDKIFDRFLVNMSVGLLQPGRKTIGLFMVVTFGPFSVHFWFYFKSHFQRMNFRIRSKMSKKWLFFKNQTMPSLGLFTVNIFGPFLACFKSFWQ